MAHETVQMLDETDFHDFILQAAGPVLIDFTAAWCGPCKVQSPILHRFAKSAGITVGTVDVDASPALAARYGVRGMPTLLVFEGGKEVARRLGLADERAIRALIEARSRLVVNAASVA